MKIGHPMRFSVDREGSQCVVAWRDRHNRGGTLTIHIAACSTLSAIFSSLIAATEDQSCSFSIDGDFSYLEPNS